MASSSSSRFALVTLALALSVTGCTTVERHRLIAQTIAPAGENDIAARHEIYVATSRGFSSEPGVVYAGERADETTFAKVSVTVPAVHEAGMIEKAPNPIVADPARYFAADSIGIFPAHDDFKSELARSIKERGGRALVFIHGFNTAFDEAIYRMTQVVHDADYQGSPILFTWASAARTIDYVYDNNSATFARDRLEETLKLVVEAGAERIDIVAHSMGSWLTMETLRQLAIAGDPTLQGRLGDVVLASPDIDVDVFKSQMRRYGKPKKPFYVLTSQRDRALSVSGLIAGNKPRVGDYTYAEDLAQFGVTVIDVTSVSGGDALNHTTFAENPALVRLLGQGLLRDQNDTDFEDDLADRIGSLGAGVGQTIGNTADIIITTPFEVLGLTLR